MTRPRRATASVLLITCEHGGAKIPRPYQPLFRGAAAQLATHEGYDIGALKVAKLLARDLGSPLRFSDVSRLLIDLNRSTHHPKVFSERTRALPMAERQAIIAAYYAPYRQDVEQWIAAQVKSGKRVVHLSIHSFTPVLGGETRRAEIGLLYDPARASEKSFVRDLYQQLSQALAASPTKVMASWRLRRNYPYQGRADGFVSHLRRRFTVGSYVGVEIEMNQALVGKAAGVRAMSRLFVAALRRKGLNARTAGDRSRQSHTAKRAQLSGSKLA